jgi:diadenylate cyclase
MFSAALEFFRSIDFLASVRVAVDIAIVAYVVYRLILLAKGRRAWQILIGLAIFFLLIFVSNLFGLVTLNWMLRQVTPLGPVAIVILLYPELRDLLEGLGRLNFWGGPLHVASRADATHTIEQVVRAATLLAPRKIGALIVMERETGLEDVAQSGTAMDAEVSSELLTTLFHPGTPLHDGAVIVRGGRIVAAGCTLHLSDSPNIGTNVHMRHRAAIGQSEHSDALVVVVSEERGTISLAIDGKLISGLNGDRLRERLLAAFGRPRGAPGAKRNPAAVGGNTSNGTAGTNGAARAGRWRVVMPFLARRDDAGDLATTTALPSHAASTGDSPAMAPPVTAPSSDEKDAATAAARRQQP